jgi:hypothetical protein
LEELVERELRDCSPAQQELFARTKTTPSKWELRPWGDEGGGFWVIAVHAARVLWYNDIEEGFNVSRFDVPGRIPGTEYWCNQDELRWALARFGDGPPEGGPHDTRAT